MDTIKKFMFADDSVLVTVISAKTLVQKAITVHGLSPVAAAALGRSLIGGAFLCNQFKDDGQKLSMTIDGGGGLGKIVVAGEAGGTVRGYVEHPEFDLPIREDGKLDVGGAVGKDGYLNVIKDLGLKEPYSGKTALVNGEIASDLAYYLTASEGQPSAVALGVLVDKTGCIGAGGIFVQPMPGCEDYVVTILEDIVSTFGNVSALFHELSVDDIIEKFFGQFDLHFLEGGKPLYKCRCSREKIEAIVLSLGEAEAREIIADEGKIEVNCQFCNKHYVFTERDVDKLFCNK